MRRVDDLWLWLYQCNTDQTLTDLFVRHAHGSRLVLRRVHRLLGDVLVPGWRSIAFGYLEGYRCFVDHWLRDTLTKEDWQRATQWVKHNGADQAEAFEWLMGTPGGFSLERWLIEQIKTRPYEPFQEAYRQILTLIRLERIGKLAFRPRFCVGCGTLMMPTRTGQRFCGRRCRFRVLQREYRATRNGPGDTNRRTKTKLGTIGVLCRSKVENEGLPKGGSR